MPYFFSEQLPNVSKVFLTIDSITMDEQQIKEPSIMPIDGWNVALYNLGSSQIVNCKIVNWTSVKPGLRFAV